MCVVWWALVHVHQASESELPRHLHRVYLTGMHTLSSPLRFPEAIPPELEPSVRKEKYEVCGAHGQVVFL